MIQLMPFQEVAIKRLNEKFKKLWKNGGRGASLIFKAPTGSGKTIMMAQFLKDLSQDPLFDIDKCFVWVSMGGSTLTQQSKKKLYDFYDGAGAVNLLDGNDFSKKKMVNNEVLFINWGKIKTSTIEGRVFRRETENTAQGMGVFDEFIFNTQEDHREIVLIIDESHKEARSKLANDIIELLDPRIKLLVSATPQEIVTQEDEFENRGGYVYVPHREVIQAGLIKEKIITQTEEDLSGNNEENIEEKLLNLAVEKRSLLRLLYQELGIQNINPLVLIQIPNKDNQEQSDEFEKKEQACIYKEHLKSQGIKDHEIGIWLSEKKENLNNIVKNNSDISFLIFKQAISTGWDCPRAQVLVMFRDIDNPTFYIQTVGRILRMPEAKHYNNSILNKSYLYTNYKKNEVFIEENAQGENKLTNNFSFRRRDVTPINLQTVYLRRQDYNDLKPADQFQEYLQKKLDDYFKIAEGDVFTQKNIEKIEVGGLQYNTESPPYDILVNAKIENYDNFVQEMQEARELEVWYSTYDVQRIYNKLCYDIIVKQENEKGKYAPARSWSILKSALNVWILTRIESNREKAYNIIVNDLLREDSALKKVLAQVFISYRDISDKYLGEIARRKKKYATLAVPPKSDSFTNDYCTMEVTKSAMSPYYRNERSNVENENSFIKYLEEKDEVLWWYKNGDSSKDYFSISYDNHKKLFYPDWFVQLKNGNILILDTKAGYTAELNDTKQKIEALHIYIQALNNYQAGIVVKHSDIWKVNINKKYNYDENCTEFVNLDILFSDI